MHSISVADDASHIIIVVAGSLDNAQALQIIREAHALGMERDIHRYLMDVIAARNVKTATDAYFFAFGDLRQAPDLDPNAKVALLVDPDDHSHDFIETTLQNSGKLVTLFRSRERALAYLLR